MIELGTLTNLMTESVGAVPFLFWVFLVGIIIASLQDLKRREVDDWLNFLLLTVGIVFVLYSALFSRDFSLVVQMGFALLVMGGAMNLFYYGRVFAGGDAKLLFAMSALFVGLGFSSTLKNIGIFLFLLMVSGSFYGIFYSGVLYFKNRKKCNAEIKKFFSKTKWLRRMFYSGLILFGCSLVVFVLFDNFLPLSFAGIYFLFPILYLFSKSLEKVSMIREVSGKDLREGDWLAHDLRVGGKTIKSDWEGLSEKSLKLLRNKKKVVIKEGLPFVPAFLIALLLYGFFKDFLLGFVFGMA